MNATGRRREDAERRKVALGIEKTAQVRGLAEVRRELLSLARTENHYQRVTRRTS